MRIPGVAWCRACDRLGYRGWDLIVVSTIWVLIGLSIHLRGDPDPEHTVMLEHFGEWLRIAIWWGAAVVGYVTAWWPPGKDRWGWTALVIPPALRALQYLVAWGLGVASGDMFGYAGAWLEAIAWTLVTLWVVRQAKRPEMPTLPHREEA